MLTIVTTHPIQYQTPIFRELARRNRVPFEVIFLCDHAYRKSFDAELGVSFSWDVDLLDGFNSRFIARGRSPVGFWSLQIPPSDWGLLLRRKSKVVWIQGWQVAGYWQAALAAKLSGANLWLRAETNLRSGSGRFRVARSAALRALFGAVDRFLCIGAANRDLYLSFAVTSERLANAPYCVENERFRSAATACAADRDAIRREWNVPADAFTFLFVGKLIDKKRPLDICAAAEIVLRRAPARKIHLLWVGAGELEPQARVAAASIAEKSGVGSSFVGFLNQSEIAKAYCAADCLILPSGPDETWGLVVNEAMASGRPAIISDACGCASDLRLPGRDDLIFRCGDIDGLAESMASAMARPPGADEIARRIAEFDITKTVDAVEELYATMLARNAT
jgi:glycosyltransferase involved in cell wall biosynthesis